jgi:hypothetical protein
MKFCKAYIIMLIYYEINKIVYKKIINKSKKNIDKNKYSEYNKFKHKITT